MQSSKSGNWIFAIPSFWGLATWTVAVAAYFFGGIGWFPPSETSIAILVAMSMSYLGSLMLFSPVIRSWFDRHFEDIHPPVGIKWIILLHVLGIGFCLLFVMDFEKSGLISDGFFRLLVDNPLEIRAVPLDGLTRGVQLSYIGWIAVFLSGASAALYKKGRLTNYLLVALQLAANLVFISKMRPIAIVFLFAFPYFVLYRRRFSFVRLGAISAILMAAIVAFFIYWSDATGKTYELGLGYPPAVETFLLYFTSGPAYLSHILEYELPDYDLSRTLRPVYMASAVIFGTDAPPSRILQYYDLPITTNVGTALEPWYRDMGFFGLGVGVVVLSFGLDAMAYWGLRFGRVTGLLLTVMMCVCSTLAFFVPRLSTGPVVGVVILFLLHWTLVQLRLLFRRPHVSQTTDQLVVTP